MASDGNVPLELPTEAKIAASRSFSLSICKMWMSKISLLTSSDISSIGSFFLSSADNTVNDASGILILITLSGVFKSGFHKLSNKEIHGFPLGPGIRQ